MEDIFIYNDDDTDKWQNDFLAELITKHLPDLRIGYSQCNSPCSDHHSWHVHGFPASYVAESDYYHPAPKFHTEHDTYVNKQHMIKFCKLALVYLAELAKIYPKSFRHETFNTSTTSLINSNTAKQIQLSTESKEPFKKSNNLCYTP